MKAHPCSVSCSRGSQDSERQMQPLGFFFCRVKADETTVWGQEAAQPQQTKNK